MASSPSSLDLSRLPPELALAVLANLDATDLCLASCVWRNLAFDDMLWKNLCLQHWPFIKSIHREAPPDKLNYRELYLHLDESKLIFNSDGFHGIEYLIDLKILPNASEDIASYLNSAPGLCPYQRWNYLESNPTVLEEYIRKQNFRRFFLPDALRHLFTKIANPHGGLQPIRVLERLMEKFSEWFVHCNANTGMSKDHVYLLCFSMILLSVDLNSPHIKNKMSKREFIRNTRDATGVNDCEYLGYLYDNIYTNGHVAALEKRSSCLPAVNPNIFALEPLVRIHAG